MKKRTALSFVFCVGLFLSTIYAATPGETSPDQVVRQYLGEVWSAGKLEKAYQLIAPEYRFHNPVIRLEGPTGPDLATSMVEHRREAFPDLSIQAVDVFTQGDKVAVRWEAKATHSGKLGDVEPTGKKISFEGISIFRVAGGRIYEEWTVDDFARVLRELGVKRMEIHR